MKDLKSKFNGNIIKWLAITLLIVVVYNFIDISAVANKRLIFSDFLNKVSNKEVKEVNILNFSKYLITNESII